MPTCWPSLSKLSAASSLVLLLLAACQADVQRATVEAPQPGASSKTTPVAKPVPVAKPEPKAQAKSQDNAGDVCSDDRGCLRYLRCIDSVCALPQAMTGTTTPETPWVEFEGKKPMRFHLELAVEDWEQMRGLMYRREMENDWGMIFIYPDMGKRSFWMKNTLMSLDMVFIRDDGVVDSVIEGAEPLTLSPRSSTGAARYVLELKAGWAAKYGIRAGTHCTMGNMNASYLPRNP